MTRHDTTRRHLTHPSQHRDELARRKVLALGGRFLLAGTVAGGLGTLVFPTPAAAIDWDALFRTMITGGFATVKRLVGQAFAGDRPLRVGSRINSGQRIRSTKGSLLQLLLSDNTALRLSGASELVLKVDNRGRGILHLLLGSILTVVPKGHHYLVMGPTATIGVKGTVFYREVFPPGASQATSAQGKTVALPEDSRDYFCTCHGDVEYLHPQTLAVALEDHADYHSAFFLNLARPHLTERFHAVINHTDGEIRDLIDLQKGKKHDASWLRA